MPSMMPLKSWRSRLFCSYSMAFHRNRRAKRSDGELGDEGDGLSRLQGEAEHVGTVVLDALGHVADRRRDGIDAPRVEVGPHHARAHRAVAVGGEPALDRLVGGVGQREHEPGRIGAGRRRPHGHAPRDAVGARRGLDLQRVAAPLVGLAQRGDLDAVEIVGDVDRLECMGRGRVGQSRQDAAARQTSADARAGSPRPCSVPGPAARCASSSCRPHARASSCSRAKRS